ncbi:unnamed protein product [Chondrus crispus]|uniref:Uncharacterized protein n=1 Tax=Chondrus crispus TaxID=2769 RepID=R7QTF2_CHOCR|nr:unnamed protein product [Chondrus crispus]CDF40791.1 unnamed protein product [Chondrus crispus]|eukprot:XP_005711085.1 unnamed protein product [Chondrus crispus]
MINLADSCIDIDYEKNRYKFFRYEWEKTESDDRRPLCVRAQDNILTEGKLIYHQKDLVPEARHFTDALKASSFGANGDKYRAVVAIQVLPEHIHGLQKITIGADTYLTGPLIISVLDSTKMKIRCYGQVYGRVGEGQTKAEIKFCLSSDSYFVFVSGYGLLTEDADSLTSRPWNVLVACSVGRVVANYSKGIDSSVPFASEARALLLGSVFNPDERSVQRYAALHSNCKDVFIPYNAPSHNQSIPNAKVLTIVHVSVEKWALVMLLACSIVLGSMGCVLNSIANWKNMPKHVFGERALAKRWCREKETQWKDEVEREPKISGKFNRWNLRRKLFPKNNPLYLSVFVGDLQDDLCITRRETVVTRDKSKTFVDIELDKHDHQDWDLESVPPPIGLPGVNMQAEENL